MVAQPVIVFAEDHRITRIAGARALSSVGYDVRQYENGADALDAVRTMVAQGHPPSAVLTDHDMPQMDGGEMIDHLRNDPDLPHDIPIVMMTGNEDARKVVEAKNFDVTFLTKPASVEDLEEAVRKAVGTHVYKLPGGHSLC